MDNTTSMPLKFKNWDIHFGIHIDVFPIIGLYNDEKKEPNRLSGLIYVNQCWQKIICVL